MKTSSKNYIVFVVLVGVTLIWGVSGAVATGAGKAPIGFWVVFGIFNVTALLFGIAGIGAERAEKKASKK